MSTRLLRLTLAVLLLVSSLATVGFGPPTLVESDSAVAPITAGALKALQADRPPRVAAKAALVVDATTGQVVFEKNAHERRAQASTTKMMTALVTLENARLDEVVEAGPNVKKVEPSIIGLDPGDELTVEQLLYGLLLPSGNDAAVALAEHVGGSIPKFAEMMNARAAQLGLKNTRFANPHGLDQDGHYSSAYDLAVLTRAAMKNPTFARIVATQEIRVQTTFRWLFKNNNRLLASYPGADGVKTGYTDNAGRCLVFSATRNGHRAISVVLSSGDIFDDSSVLLDYFFNNYGWETLNPADLPLSDFGQEGTPLRTVARSQPQVVLANWQRPYLRWFFAASPNPSRGDGAAGTATYYLFGRKVAEIEMFSEGR